MDVAPAPRPRRDSPEAFLALPLVVHSVLSDVPLQDVTVVDLPGGGRGRTVADIRLLRSRSSAGGPAKALFAFRRSLGRLFGWDTPQKARRHSSYRDRIDEAVLRRSTAQGTKDGPFETLYELDDESLVEARNATVHAFMCVALVPRESGYRLYWAVYVKPVSSFSSLYMALIEPFRRFIVYPSLLRNVQRAWIARYALPPSPPASPSPQHPIAP